jgi:hypothetical protein
MSRPCEWCFEPLPENAWHGRKYHDECRIFVDRLLNSQSAKRMRLKKKMHIRPRNPLKLLGLDYVTLKLAGESRRPQDAVDQFDDMSRRTKINIKPDPLY